MELISKIFSVILLAELSYCQLTIDISCSYSLVNYIKESKIQTCTVSSPLRIDKEGMEIYVLNFIKTKSVEAFVAKDKEISYFPNGIDKSFPELKFLIIQNSKLRKISANDLKNFTDLKYLDLSYNEIEVLEANIFRIKIPLKTILLNGNKIKSVDLTAFKEPYMYEYLDFSDNLCISGWGESLEKRTALIDNIYANCSTGGDDLIKMFNLRVKNPFLLVSGFALLIVIIIAIVCLTYRKTSATKPKKFQSTKVYGLTVLSSMNNIDTIRPQNPYECQEMYEEMNYGMPTQAKHEPEDNDFYSETQDFISQDSMDATKADIYTSTHAKY